MLQTLSIAAELRPLHRVRPLIADLPISKIIEVAVAGLHDPDVVALWFGESDLITPSVVCEAAAKALHGGHTFYTFKKGIPELRRAIANYLSSNHQRPVSDDRVIVTSSGGNAIMLTCQTLLDPGDNVVIVTPLWPNAADAISAVGAEPRAVGLTLREDGTWTLELDRVFAACDARTRAVFVNSPNNPTGWMMDRVTQEALMEFTRARGIWLIADEVYSRIVYDGRAAPSFLDFAEPDDGLIVINSFSKTWAMTGWRLGWMIAPRAIQDVADKVVEFNTSGAPTFLQFAGVAALEQGEPFVTELVDHCRRGRDVLVDGLKQFPRLSVSTPAGAFYAFCRVDGMKDSLTFAKALLAQCKVGVAPGIAFGEAGEGFLRLCFASRPARLNLALARMAPMFA